jgi:hypothetical protein
MTQRYGIEAPRAQVDAPALPPVRHLVLIDSASSAARVARLFLATHEEVAEFEASAAEVLSMTDGLVPSIGATGHEWDLALAGHSAQERATAEVYTLQI